MTTTGVINRSLNDQVIFIYVIKRNALSTKKFLILFLNVRQSCY